MRGASFLRTRCLLPTGASPAPGTEASVTRGFDFEKFREQKACGKNQPVPSTGDSREREEGARLRVSGLR